MGVKLFLGNLNYDFYPSHLTSTYTYGVWLSRQGCAVVGKKKKKDLVLQYYVILWKCMYTLRCLKLI